MKSRTKAAVLTAALALSGSLAAAQTDFTIEAEARGSLERLTGGRADWRNTQLDLQARNAARQSYYGYLRATERFAQRDGEMMIGTYQPLGGAWAMQAEAAVSPTHHVLARRFLFAQLEHRFGDGWGVQAGYRRSEYERTGSDLVIATVDRYFSSFRVAYSLYLGRPDNASFGPSHRLQWSYYYGDRSFLGVSAAAGKEVENIVPSGVQSTQVRNLTLAGRHEFAPGWALSYEWLAHRQGDFYTRRGFGIGIRHAF